MSQKFRNWCFTAYENFTIDTQDVNYYIYQKEICPTTGQEHIQGYIELTTPRDMKWMKTKILKNNTIHLETRKGSQQQAIDYCKKEETRAPSSEPVEWGIPKQQGQRSDLAEIWEDIENGTSIKHILQKHKMKALSMIHAIEKAHKYLNTDTYYDSMLLWKKLYEQEPDNTHYRELYLAAMADYTKHCKQL